MKNGLGVYNNLAQKLCGTFVDDKMDGLGKKTDEQMNCVHRGMFSKG